MTPVLRVEGLSTGYNKLEILHNVSLFVDEGEVVAILGPNGAGKSTLLRAVASLLPKWSGKVYFNDEDVTNYSAKELLSRGLVYVMQGRNVFPFMTVYENLEIAGLMIKDKKLFRERLEEIYSMFPVLKEKRSKKAHKLSGGEQRILELAKAFMYRPKLLMLDEPSIGLAPKIVHQLYHQILSLAKTLNFSLLLVEQNVSKALEVADRVYVLDLGEVKFSGTPHEAVMSKSLTATYLGV